MNYIFCPSYASVFFALHLKNSGEEIKIITDNMSINRYCQTAGIERVYFNYIGVPTTRFYEMFSLKSRMDALIKNLDVYLIRLSLDQPEKYP